MTAPNIPPLSENFRREPASLELVKVTKKFGDFTACSEVTFKVPPGTVHALLGENGAGKSTLVKCVMGFHSATSGDIVVGGQSRDINHPADAGQYGIGMVYQHFTLVPSMTVTENLLLARTDLSLVVNWKEERKRLETFMKEDAPFLVPLNKKVCDLSAGEKQKTEILKQLYLQNRILILDEPTSVLTPSEADEVLNMLRKMVSAGSLSIIIITHKFREVFSFADDVTVLRRGMMVGGGKVADLDRDTLAGMMMGEPVKRTSAGDAKAETAKPAPAKAPRDRRLKLKIEKLCAAADTGVETVREIDLSVYAGEVVGIAGVSGNGQRELFEVLAGQRRATSGSVLVNDEPYHGSRKQILRHKVHTLPEEPLRNACAPTLSVAENMALRTFDLAPATRWKILLSNRAVRSAAAKLIDQFAIKTRGPDTPIRDLSGGNVQRAVLARELVTAKPELLFIAEPCFGLDFKATEFVHQQIREARDRGTAVLVVSSDLDELLKISDRMLVMSGGRIAYETPTAEADIGVVGRSMAGH